MYTYWRSFFNMFRLTCLFLWTGLIFIFTCSVSMEEIFLHGSFQFHWNSNPNWGEFFYPLPASPDEAFISRKLGHAVSFFILFVIGYLRFFSIQMMLVLTFFYATMTEVLQLFFYRGGRLFDIGFDGIGIIMASVLIGLAQYNEKSLTRKSQT
jgi:VanZ family protein